MPDRLWSAVTRRDSKADGLFVYAVRSTRIYCRPSCGSRKPGRDGVEFFPSPAMARVAGYRPCRRCHPDIDVPGETTASRRVGRVCRAVAEKPDARWSAGYLAQIGGTSVIQLQRAFRSVLGVTPSDYVAACRRRRFLLGLRSGQSVTAALYDAGFSSPSRMYGAVRLPGMRPATYGRGGKGASIEWLTTDSPLGLILVASTASGLCFVAVGPSVAALKRELDAEYPEAVIADRPSPGLRPLTDTARAVAEARPVLSSVPIDIRGTAFQWRVWRALTRIPPGETRTYTDVASAIGASSSVRAVARACATNPVALVVPCHRVIGADHELRGYRWGLDVKRKLIESERTRSGRRLS
jgi:AraC family transcriptional regulator of adaptative response/methylated-DNA-[protein]-cysteine methyltransferase